MIIGEFPKIAKEAIEGNIESQYILGCHYLAGEHVYIDIQEAIYWWIKSAQQEHIASQYQLGAIYLSLKQYDDYLYQSKKWLTKASNKGCLKSKNLLNFMELNKLI